MRTKWITLEDGTVWPTPMDGDDEHQAGLEWILRYGSDEALIKARMQAASIVSAYRSLIHSTHARQRQVTKALRAADHSDDGKR